MGFTGLNWVLPSITGFDLVLPSFTGFYLILLGFTLNSWVFLTMELLLPFYFFGSY